MTAMDPAKSTTIRSLASHHVNLGTRIIKFYSVSLKITQRLLIHIYLCKPEGPCQRMQPWGASGNAQCRAPCWERNRCPWDRTWVNRIIEDEYRLNWYLVWKVNIPVHLWIPVRTGILLPHQHVVHHRLSRLVGITINVSTWSQKWALMK